MFLNASYRYLYFFRETIVRKIVFETYACSFFTRSWYRIVEVHFFSPGFVKLQRKFNDVWWRHAAEPRHMILLYHYSANPLIAAAHSYDHQNYVFNRTVVVKVRYDDTRCYYTGYHLWHNGSVVIGFSPLVLTVALLQM